MSVFQVSILKRDGTQSIFYATYTLAIPHAVSGDLIQIWADLNEQIILKNGVDIWIMPGVELNNTSGVTITDIVSGISQEIHCKIYGMGKIKNTAGYSCVFINNVLSELSIECDYIEGISGISVYISHGSKFHINCNNVINRDGQAIQLGEILSTGLIQDVNINISKVETGNTSSPYTGVTAIITRCNGFIKIDEVKCKNLGHCLSHREGSIIARIKKMSTTNNYTSSGNAGSTVIVGQYNYTVPGLGTQKLILYFDEILAIEGQANASVAIEHHEGTGVFIGRRVYSDSAIAMQISQAGSSPSVLPKGYVKIQNIISGSGVALVLNDFTDQITIDSKSIEGNGGAVIYSSGSSINRGNYIIRNAKIRNKSTSSSAKGIYFENIYPIATLNNVQFISGSDAGSNIFLANGTSIDVYNYGLFGNVGIDDEKIKLKIGTWIEPDELYNFQCIIDSDLN